MLISCFTWKQTPSGTSPLFCGGRLHSWRTGCGWSRHVVFQRIQRRGLVRITVWRLRRSTIWWRVRNAEVLGECFPMVCWFITLGYMISSCEKKSLVRMYLGRRFFVPCSCRGNKYLSWPLVFLKHNKRTIIFGQNKHHVSICSPAGQTLAAQKFWKVCFLSIRARFATSFSLDVAVFVRSNTALLGKISVCVRADATSVSFFFNQYQFQMSWKLCSQRQTLFDPYGVWRIASDVSLHLLRIPQHKESHPPRRFVYHRFLDAWWDSEALECMWQALQQKLNGYTRESADLLPYPLQYPSTPLCLAWEWPFVVLRLTNEDREIRR